MEFTFDEYGRLLDSLIEDGYTFTDYERMPSRGQVILRHDVDWSPEKALRMARMEADRDIRATYFFLVTTPFYNVHARDIRESIAEIEALGHDIGLHFSTHEYWREEPLESDLIRRIDGERQALDPVVGDLAETIAFHIPPEWTLDRSFNGFVNSYEPRFFSAVTYLGDSGQRWRSGHPFEEEIPERMQLLTHPGLWGDADATFEERLEQQQERRFDAVQGFLASEFLSEGGD
ncbi:hypothetical protein [Haloprofundus halobius]|uniref:hypothetical protein n=1 Tax=Haloprofundus halobius TaxID=2876194 RepID=UPI001CC92E38|nr:hypothetical protein [Haloprofundus halobius]